MSESKSNNDDVQDSRHPAIVILYNLLIMLGIVGIALLIPYTIITAQKPVIEQAMADIEAEQVAESSHHTAVVTAVDMSNGTVTLDNGDILPADALKMTPNIDDILSYTKTFEYEISKWDGTPKRTEKDAFLNVESINQASK